MPPHNRNFVGRVNELRRLRESLALGRIGAIAAVHGLGGMGKTALAFEYAHAFAGEYPGGRFLVPCTAQPTCALPIVNLAEYKGVTLDDADRKDIGRAFARVRAAFENGPRSLLVLDNIDDPKLLAPARAETLPASDNVHVLATTRLEATRLVGVDCLALDALPEADGARLLEKHRAFESDADRQAAARIVVRLGGFPLAIEVVAVFLWQNPDISYEGYAGAGAPRVFPVSTRPPPTTWWNSVVIRPSS